MISWHEETWLISKLKKFDRNPRKITEKEYKRLKASIEAVGYNSPILIQPDGTIISGHQRASVLRDLGYDTVDVRVPSKELTKDEFNQVLIQSNLTAGQFDIDILSTDFDMEELSDWGMGKAMLEDYMDDPKPDKEKVPVTCPHCGELIG